VRKLVLLGSSIPLAPRASELAAQVRAQPGWVVLRPSGFTQNFLSPHPPGERIRRDGEIRTAAAADAGVRAGREGELSTAVLDLTGRAPRTFAQFVQEHAARWIVLSRAG
jgi:hypothetical protein